MKEQEKTELTEKHDGKEEEEWKDASEIQNEERKMNRVTGFGIAILILAVIVLSVCVVYSQNLNKNLAEKTAEVQNEYKKLQESIKGESSEAEITEIPQKDESEELPSVSSDEQKEETEGTNQEKVLTIPEDTAEYVLYENYIEGKKFSFSYPSSWDGKVIFSNETLDDGTVVITCYASGQYSDYQNGAPETGEIFHIVVNKNPAYQSENNKQYKMSEKDDYCGYYEEPSGITYDYVNHPEYAEVFKLIYESQAKVWRSFNFD